MLIFSNVGYSLKKENNNKKKRREKQGYQATKQAFSETEVTKFLVKTLKNICHKTHNLERH